MKKILKIILLSFLFVAVLISCEDDKTQDIQQSTQGTQQYSGGSQESSSSGGSTPSSTEKDYTKWSTSDPLYTMTYDSSNKEFECDYPYVVFVEKDPLEDFKILNLTDIQIEILRLDKDDDYVVFFKKTMDELIKQVDPDLITVTGDFGDYSSTKDCMKFVCDIIDSYHIPWAPILGNHDNEGLVTQKAKLLEGYDYCLFKSGPTNLATIDLSVSTDNPALGNYVINIVQGDTLVNSLIFMNTGSYYIESPKLSGRSWLTGSNWGRLSDKQISWYKWAVNSAKNYNANVKSTLFVHIPIFEYVKAICAAVKGSHSYNNILTSKSELLGVTSKISIADSYKNSSWNSGYEGSFGVIHDDAIATSHYDDGVFKAIKDCGSTNLVICGHDHSNNTVIKHQGVTLAYATKTGKGCYWDEDCGLSGGTKITINSTSTNLEHIIYMPQ